MFQALVMVCALADGLLTPNCKALEDTLGPYASLEQCATRAQEMDLLVGTDPAINYYAFSLLGFPEAIVTQKQCIEKDGWI